MNYENLGLPYMGSKRRLSNKIANFILEQNPKCRYVYDLFGGGAAVSLAFLQRPKIEKVVYNEFNTGICELLRKIQTGGITPEFYKWISREEFRLHKNDNDWYGGLIKVCWSFGNNQRDYIYAPEVEKMKRILHFSIVENELSERMKYLDEFAEIYKLQIPVECVKFDTILQRRLNVARFIQNDAKRRATGNGIAKTVKDGKIRFYMQNLEGLQHLEGLGKTNILSNLEIQNKSYEQVEITTPIEETVIYLDPPYKNTGKYQHGIDHAALIDYVKSSKYKIYMSSYESELIEVKQFTHMQTLCATKSSKVVERLFSNQPKNNNYELF